MCWVALPKLRVTKLDLFLGTLWGARDSSVQSCVLCCGYGSSGGGGGGTVHLFRLIRPTNFLSYQRRSLQGAHLLYPSILSTLVLWVFQCFLLCSCVYNFQMLISRALSRTCYAPTKRRRGSVVYLTCEFLFRGYHEYTEYLGDLHPRIHIYILKYIYIYIDIQHVSSLGII